MLLGFQAGLHSPELTKTLGLNWVLTEKEQLLHWNKCVETKPSQVLLVFFVLTLSLLCWSEHLVYASFLYINSRLCSTDLYIYISFCLVSIVNEFLFVILVSFGVFFFFLITATSWSFTSSHLELACTLCIWVYLQTLLLCTVNGYSEK